LPSTNSSSRMIPAEVSSHFKSTQSLKQYSSSQSLITQKTNVLDHRSPEVRMKAKEEASRLTKLLILHAARTARVRKASLGRKFSLSLFTYMSPAPANGCIKKFSFQCDP